MTRKLPENRPQRQVQERFRECIYPKKGEPAAAGSPLIILLFFSGSPWLKGLIH